MMSATMEPEIETAVPAADSPASDNELSEVEVDGDGSSSLSDIEDKDGEPDELEQNSSDESDDEPENDSEAETERLEASPEKLRKRKDVVLNSRSESQTFERSPSKLQNVTKIAEGDDEDDDEDDDTNQHPDGDDDAEPLSDEEGSLAGSTKTASNGDDDHATGDTSLEGSSGEGKAAASRRSRGGHKRKRSQAVDLATDTVGDDDGPARKRTGSVIPAKGNANDDNANGSEAIESNLTSGDLSEEDTGTGANDDEAAAEEEHVDKAPRTSPSKRDRRKTWRRRRGPTNGSGDADNEQEASENNGEDNAENATEADGDGDGDDDAEAILRSEEELRRKRVAMDQLTEIEKHFSAFRERLFDERLSQLEQQESMLKNEPPTHPEYLAMLEAVIERKEERTKEHQALVKHQLLELERTAVAKRSQAFAQYYQRVREIREKALDRLGRQWYSIQHDRRAYAGSVPDYTIKFPQRRQQQILHQTAYNKEVSILSGVAKHVGFPAAPPMASASQSEYEQDLEKMNVRAKELAVQRAQLGLPAQGQAAFRASYSSMFSNKPAEDQFIEQTPWANPQHPSHVHLLQRQSSASNTPRRTSPAPQATLPRRQSAQNSNGAPVSGTFYKANATPQPNSATTTTASHNNPFSASHQPQRSPQLTRNPGSSEHANGASDFGDTVPASNPPRMGTFASQSGPGSGVYDSDIPIKREQAVPATGRF